MAQRNFKSPFPDRADKICQDDFQGRLFKAWPSKDPSSLRSRRRHSGFGASATAPSP
jgi:hypothetical protein